MSECAGRLENRVAVITGAAAGIGRAIASQLYSEGASVVISDVNREGAEDTARELGGFSVETDVRDSESVNRLADTVMREWGRVDILVNNAGVHMPKLVVDLSDDDWDRILQVNARGCFYTCRAFAPHMMRAESGRMINIITRLGGNPFSSAYVASKSAIWGLTQCLALELAPYGVTVNAVAPGHIGRGTGMEKWFRSKADQLGMNWEEFERNVLKSIPLGRWCTPEDVAAAVTFVASDEATYMTGEQVNITGGWTGYGTTPGKVAR